MKNPEDNKFRIFAPYHTTISILQDTHDNVLSLFAVVCVIIIIIYCMMENGGRWELLSKLVPFLHDSHSHYCLNGTTSI